MTSVLDQSGTQPVLAGSPNAPATWVQVMSDIEPRYGGMSAAVPELSRALAGVHINAPIAALCREEECYSPPQLSAGAVCFLPRSRGAWMLQEEPRASLAGLVRPSDGIHAHGLWTTASQITASMAQRFGKPFCVSAHGMLEPWSLNQHRLRKQIYAALVEHRILRGAACLHALTQAEARSYREIAPHVPVAVVPNGVSVPSDASADLFFTEYPHLRDRRIVLFLGRLHPKKGIDLLLRSWPAVQAQHPSAHLVVAGAGDADYEEQLHAHVDAHEMRSHVCFTGLLKHDLKWSALCAAECFVLPSHSEGLSVAILESLGVGTPVLATPQCNMPELETYGCGWLSEAAQDELTIKLREMLERSPAENCLAGSRGRALIQKRYAWDAVALQMAEVYRWLNGAALPTHTEVLQ